MIKALEYKVGPYGSVRPKFGIGYGIFFFKYYSFFPTSWGNTSFYKLENKPSPSKII